MIIPTVELIADGDVRSYCWSHLRAFHNVSHVTDLLVDLHKPPAHQRANVRKQAEQIRYCLHQAREYADAAETVSLATRPNLLYYSIMSLALAEVLFKQDGASSLDRAREQNKHHGLTLKVGGGGGETTLTAAAESLRAVPLVHANGDRFGTFELWHRSCREMPIGGEVSSSVVGGGTIKSVELILGSADDRLNKLPRDGLTLLECLLHIPGLLPFFTSKKMDAPIVRGRMTAAVHPEQRKRIVTTWFHPGPIDTWKALSARIKFAPGDFEALNISERAHQWVRT